MSNTLVFLGQFLKSPFRTGAIAPSSRVLAREMVRNIDVGPGDVVVEYGPGTGSFTRMLAPLAERGVRYLGIERNPRFHEMMTAAFPQLTFVEGGAEDVAKHLEERGLPAPKAVISGLPIAAMPMPVQKQIIAETSRVLAPGGVFHQFSYCHFYPVARPLRQLMRAAFDSFELSRPVMRNVPPAFVYIGRNAPAAAAGV